MSQLELVQELRAARPVAPEALRERVRALAPPPPRRFTFELRRFVPAAAGVGLAGALGVALVLGILHSAPMASKGEQLRASRPPRASHARQNVAGATRAQGRDLTGKLPVFSAALRPFPGRLQQYDAFLRVRVDSQEALSKQTQDALRYTRRVGGYVVWARYGAPGKRGDSELALRVPIARVQDAIAHFSAYGELVRQRVVLKDLQNQVDKLAARIRALEDDLAVAQRQGLEQRVHADRALLASLEGQRMRLVHRGQFARVALTMVVGKTKPAAAAGRFDRTLDKAGSVLVRELEILLYALIVAGPLLLLGGLAVLAGRAQRRRADERLLERT